MSPDEQLQIPLALAEMLHAILGPLLGQLEGEGHSWVPILKRVLEAYGVGRDDILISRHGVGILSEIDGATRDAAEQLCEWVSEMAREEEDFKLWAEEFLHGNETAS